MYSNYFPAPCDGTKVIQLHYYAYVLSHELGPDLTNLVFFPARVTGGMAFVGVYMLQFIKLGGNVDTQNTNQNLIHSRSG